MHVKADEIRDYFDGWQENLARVKSLMEVPEYYREAWLVLCCYVGAFGSLRYPGLRDNEKYKKAVREYSGMTDFYDQIDLFFFMQWPRSEFRDEDRYKRLKNYKEISNAIVAKYGEPDQIRVKVRYVPPNEFVACIEQAPFPGYDRQNLLDHIHLFSLCEMLYHYARCPAVHNVRFPFVTRITRVDRSVRYEDNHAITGDRLLETAQNILSNLSKECIEKTRWPWEL
ncbi:MAG: hypothetical protein IPO99_17225 [Nitrospira sp.]|nr:hypothetical protein [Nitrospira sp.]SLM44025.1 conserved hypothetical protein [Nitrospira sp. ND1]